VWGEVIDNIFQREQLLGNKDTSIIKELINVQTVIVNFISYLGNCDLGKRLNLFQFKYSLAHSESRSVIRNFNQFVSKIDQFKSDLVWLKEGLKLSVEFLVGCDYFINEINVFQRYFSIIFKSLNAIEFVDIETCPYLIFLRY